MRRESFLRFILSGFLMFGLMFGLMFCLTASVGCKSGVLHMQGKNAAEEAVKGEKTDKKDEKKDKKPFFVGDSAVPVGLDLLEINAVGLATNLPGTGSDPPESNLRTMLLKEMSSQNVEKPGQLLADPSTSLVIATGHLPPGVQKGDRFDIEITLPTDSETTSLRGGYLLPARLKEVKMLDRLREGNKVGTCAGPILVEPLTGDDRDKQSQRRGKVLGGGVATTSRFIGLRLLSESDKPDPYMTMKMEGAINRRFHVTRPSGLKENVVKAKTDKFMELTPYPKYKNNLGRFIEVVRCIPINETEDKRINRLATLQARLLEPTSARRAALELEAIGQPAIETLKTGLESQEPLVRYHAAQALAYLDVSEAAQALGETALKDPDNRRCALLALSALDDLYAYEELRKLMDAPTAETRYGAFRAIKQMRPDDPLVKGEELGEGTFNLCVVGTTGKPMLHITRSQRAEIVLFGKNQQFKHPITIEGANGLVIRSLSPTQVLVSRFKANQQDQQRTVAPGIEHVIRALSEVGATYPDVIEILQSAIARDALDTTLKVDAVPKS